MRRRDFLSCGAAALAVLVPGPAVALTAPGRERRLLILVELKGGNDGLNTVIPYADEAYYGLRPRLAIPRPSVLMLDEWTGLHPSLTALLPIWRAGELAIVQGVGYPAPNFSHFRSIEIWDTASKSHEYLSEGWLSRVFAAAPVPAEYMADGVVIASNDLGPMGGRGGRTVAFDEPENFQRMAKLAGTAAPPPRGALAHLLRVEGDIVDAAARIPARTEFRSEFPRGPFGQAVRAAARIAANPSGAAAIRLTLNGFDTHQGQLGTHANLLGTLASGLAALRAALVETGRWDSTLVMTYAEFGRRPKENETTGTDHGTAAPHFVMGGAVRGGLWGPRPNLEGLVDGNLIHAIDFRSYYSTALAFGWGMESKAILGGHFEPLPILKA